MSTTANGAGVLQNAGIVVAGTYRHSKESTLLLQKYAIGLTSPSDMKVLSLKRLLALSKLEGRTAAVTPTPSSNSSLTKSRGEEASSNAENEP